MFRPRHGLADVEVLQVTGRAGCPCRRMQYEVRKPDQLIVLLGHQSVYCRAAIDERRPGLLGDIWCQRSAVERQIAVPQWLPAFAVLRP